MTPEQRQDVHDALLAYWTSRDEAALRQASRGRTDAGERSSSTSGGHLDRVAQVLARACVRSGAPEESVYYKPPKGDPKARPGTAAGYTLPGYYRPTKQWDVVVHHQGKPVVVIELKSQTGPSFGNNANNRAEEAIGSAVDLERARSAGLVPGRPWLGYVFVIEDAEKSRKPGGKYDRGFHAKDEVFKDWTYVRRAQLLCQRLVEDGVYDASWAVATSKPPQFGWAEPDPTVSGYAQFSAALARQIRRHFDAPSGEPKVRRPSPR